MAAKLKKATKSSFLAGKDKGEKGEINSLIPKPAKLVVTASTWPSATRSNPRATQGGRTPKAMPIHCPTWRLDANGKATRVGFRMEGDKKVRFAKTTGDVI